MSKIIEGSLAIAMEMRRYIRQNHLKEHLTPALLSTAYGIAYKSVFPSSD